MDKDIKEEFGKIDQQFVKIDQQFVKIDQQFDKLGQILKKSFDGIDKRFELVDKRFEAIDKRFEHLEIRVEDGFQNVNARLFVIERDIAEIRAHFVYRPEFEDLMSRVKYLETKLGVESGK